MRMYQGNVPSDGLGYEQVAEAVYDDMTWTVYAKHGDDGWVHVKLVASEPVSSKANYWFGYHVSRDKFNGHKDYVNLKENRPELLSDARLLLRECFG